MHKFLGFADQTGYNHPHKIMAAEAFTAQEISTRQGQISKNEGREFVLLRAAFMPDYVFKPNQAKEDQIHD